MKKSQGMDVLGSSGELRATGCPRTEQVKVMHRNTQPSAAQQSPAQSSRRADRRQVRTQSHCPETRPPRPRQRRLCRCPGGTLLHAREREGGVTPGARRGKRRGSVPKERGDYRQLRRVPKGHETRRNYCPQENPSAFPRNEGHLRNLQFLCSGDR